MIEKFTKDEIESAWAEPVAGNIQSIYGKINELIDVVNKQEQVIKMLIDGLERFAKSQQKVNMEITTMITKGGDNE